MKLHFLFALCAPIALLAGCGGGLDPNPGSNGPTTLSARLSNDDLYDPQTDRVYDIFVCDALYSGSARVAMQSSEFDTQFYVYEKNPDGSYTLIDDNDDANSSTTDSDDNFPVVQGQTYRILATSSLPDERGLYQIRFSEELSRPAQVSTQDGFLEKNQSKFALPKRGK